MCKINFDPPPQPNFFGAKARIRALARFGRPGGRRAGRQRVRRWGRALGLSSGPAFRGTTLGASAVGDSTEEPVERGGGSRPGNVFRKFSYVPQTPPLPHLTYLWDLQRPLRWSNPRGPPPACTLRAVHRGEGGESMIPPSPPTPDLPLPSPKVYSHLAYPRPPSAHSYSALPAGAAHWNHLQRAPPGPRPL